MPSFRQRFSERTNSSHRFVIAAHPPPQQAWSIRYDQYRYSLPKPFKVDQSDEVLKFIIRTIKNLNTKDINVATQKFWIQGLTCHLPVWPLNYHNAQFPVKLYAIKRCWEEFPVCIAVMVEDRGSMNPVLTSDRVKAKIHPPVDGDEWKTIEQFLKSWATPRFLGRIHPAFKNEEAQRKWWRLTGKPFRFLDLPKEIRFQVLIHALGSEIRPKARRDSSMQMDIIDFTAPRRDSADPNKAIFQVSTQVRDEAWEAMLNGTEKVFYMEHHLERVLACQVPPAPASSNWLSKVTLKLTTTQFFTFFGWSFDPTLRPLFRERGAAQLLQCSFSIKELTLDFQNPYIDGRNPWRPRQWMTDTEDRSFPFTRYQNYHSTSERYSPCYRALVEWILILAFPHIKGVPKANLCGSIKKDTNEAWSRILAIEYDKSVGKEVYYKHNFDYETSVAYLQRIPTSDL